MTGDRLRRDLDDADRRVELAEQLLAQELRETPSPHLAARVREQIRREPAPVRGGWLGGAAAAATAVVLVAAALVAWRLGTSPPPEPAPGAIASIPVPEPAQPKPEPPPAVQVQAPPPQPRVRATVRRAPEAPAFPEVIVLADEKAALRRLADDIARRPRGVTAAGSLEREGDGDLEPLFIAHLTIAPVVIDAITADDEQSLEPPARRNPS